MEKNVVILGAGFGGLRAAMKLGKEAKKGRLKDHEVILIDKNDYHTYTPTLYEISTTSKEVANYIDLKSVNTFSITNLLKNLPVKFIHADITKIDVQKGDIHLGDGRHMPYDHLIIALGSETSFFNIPGLKENALELNGFIDAIRIRDKVLKTIETAPRNEVVNIVIGGGGPTGVELAGEIQKWLAQLKAQGSNCKTNVSIINSGPEILPRFDKRLVKKATKRLEKLKTELILDETIEKISKDTVTLKSGRMVPFHVFIWAGGVKANSLAAVFPFKTERREQITVSSKMLCVPSKPDLNIRGKIYAIGDIVCMYNQKTGDPVPGVARVAISQANVVAENISRDIRGIDKHVEYKPMDYPYIAPVGGKYAIAKFGPIVISGLLGWLLKGLVELNYLVSIMPTTIALTTWMKGLKIFIQNDRLG